MTLSCIQLTEFGLEGGQITLTGAPGLVKICRSDDGVLMLVCDEAVEVLDPAHAAPVNFAVADTILGFVLDIGIQRIKILSRSNGYYFGTQLMTPQSPRVVAQRDYDEQLFTWIRASIDTSYQSADRAKVTDAIRAQHLLDTYNNARLLYPSFISESYLSLLRIIEAFAGTGGRFQQTPR